MARTLSAKAVQSEIRIGYHADAAQPGLYLQVAGGSKSPTRSWIFRYVSPISGKRRDMGLGSTTSVGLADARKAAQNARTLLTQKLDPLEERKAQLAALRAEAARTITFDIAAKSCIETKAPEWTNPKHAAQWAATLSTYASRHIGDKPVRDITVVDVLKVLEPIWTTKTETATRVRQRIETVLDWAAARGYRADGNPASLKGNLAQLLPRASKIKRVKHHPALPFTQINQFVSALRTRAGVSAVALELLILTATRANEVVNATWAEIDLPAKIWTIPAIRMKAKREHRIPLCDRAVQILTELRSTATSHYVFPGQSLRGTKPLSSAAILKLIKGMTGYESFVTHGFRSTFRDWAAETTPFPNETIEMALAHTIKNRAEAAYRRGDMLAKRVEVMDAWGKYIETPWGDTLAWGSNVTLIQIAAGK
jgi:integrase